MQKNAHKTRAGLLLMAVLALGAAALYMLVNVDFENEKLFAYAMRIRAPKLFAMMITAFAIGGASLIFQSVINNTIVTPCLLGMNSLYMLIHTAVIFAAGSGSILAVNAKAAFGVDLLIMGTAATVIYSTLFRKTGHNVLYVLLIGTVLNSFFGSVQSALTRIMISMRICFPSSLRSRARIRAASRHCCLRCSARAWMMWRALSKNSKAK